MGDLIAFPARHPAEKIRLLIEDAVFQAAMERVSAQDLQVVMNMLATRRTIETVFDRSRPWVVKRLCKRGKLPEPVINACPRLRYKTTLCYPADEMLSLVGRGIVDDIFALARVVPFTGESLITLAEFYGAQFGECIHRREPERALLLWFWLPNAVLSSWFAQVESA